MAVPVSMKIDELLFFDALKIINRIPGISDISADLDNLEGPKRKPKLPKSNGAHQPRGEGGLTALLIGFLFKNGPQPLAALRELAASKGYAETGVDSSLNALRKKGMTESGGVGIHKLTEKTMLDLQSEMEPPRLALPAPKPEPSTSPMGQGLIVILRTMQASQTGDTSRAFLMNEIERAGLSPRTVDGALESGRKKGFVKIIDKGVYQLTAKGRAAGTSPRNIKD